MTQCKPNNNIIYRSEILSGVLQELESVQTDLYEDSKLFYESVEQHMEKISESFFGKSSQTGLVN